MRVISKAIVVALFVASCNNGQTPNQPEAVIVDSSTTKEQVKPQIPAPTESEIVTLLNNMPGGRCFKTISDQFMTKDYMVALKEAREVPSDGLDGVGSEEFLDFIMIGHSEANGVLASIKNMTQEGNRCSIDLNLCELNPNDNYQEYLITFDEKIKESVQVFKPEVKRLELVYENGKWLIDDFNGSKQTMKNYVSKQRKYFNSEEWVKYYTDCIRQAEENNDESWKENTLESVAKVKQYMESLKTVR